MTRALLVGLLAALLPGCGPSTASVAGKLTYQGKPVVSGTLTLKAADGSAHQIGLNPDGGFRLDGVPVGPARVGVSSPDPRPHAKPRGGGEDRAATATAPVPGWFPLPDKFADPDKSGLTVQVGGGPADLDLK